MELGRVPTRLSGVPYVPLVSGFVVSKSRGRAAGRSSSQDAPGRTFSRSSPACDIGFAGEHHLAAHGLRVRNFFRNVRELYHQKRKTNFCVRTDCLSFLAALVYFEFGSCALARSCS